MGVWVCVSSETVWFPTLIGQKQGSLCCIVPHLIKALMQHEFLEMVLGHSQTAETSRTTEYTCDIPLNLSNKANMPRMKPYQCVFNLIQFPEYLFSVVLNNTHFPKLSVHFSISALV